MFSDMLREMVAMIQTNWIYLYSNYHPCMFCDLITGVDAGWFTEDCMIVFSLQPKQTGVNR